MKQLLAALGVSVATGGLCAKVRVLVAWDTPCLHFRAYFKEFVATRMFFDVQERLNAALSPGGGMRPALVSRGWGVCVRRGRCCRWRGVPTRKSPRWRAVIDSLLERQGVGARGCWRGGCGADWPPRGLPAVQRASRRGGQRSELLFTGPCADCGQEGWGERPSSDDSVAPWGAPAIDHSRYRSAM